MSPLHPDRSRTVPAPSVPARPSGRRRADRGIGRRVGDAPQAAAPGLAPVDDLSALTSDAEAVALAGVPDLAPAPVLPGRPRRRWHAPPARARRPAAYLAAALVGAAALGALTVGDRVAQAAGSGSSVSVAEELGLDTRSDATPVLPDAERLQELTASRTAREAEQAAAAQAQVEADRLASEAAAAAAAEAARPQAVLPVAGARLTSGFGERWGRMHAGIDLAAPMRTPEYAAMDGVVLEAGPASGYGLVVYIQHENGDVTVYGHMDEILVQPGQVVRAGDTIALLGNRGQSTGPHLHFEVIIGGLGGEKVDPVPWLRERGVAV
ncbi:M23 family metallopeptidase [Geodermatophilus sp. SYSU D00758]